MRWGRWESCGLVRWRRAWWSEGGAATFAGCGTVKEAGRKDQWGGEWSGAGEVRYARRAAPAKWAWEVKQWHWRSCSSESEGEGENGRWLGREWEGERMGLRDLGGKWVFIVRFFFFFKYYIYGLGLGRVCLIPGPDLNLFRVFFKMKTQTQP